MGKFNTERDDGKAELMNFVLIVTDTTCFLGVCAEYWRWSLANGLLGGDSNPADESRHQQGGMGARSFPNMESKRHSPPVITTSPPRAFQRTRSLTSPVRGRHDGGDKRNSFGWESVEGSGFGNEHEHEHESSSSHEREGGKGKLFKSLGRLLHLRSSRKAKSTTALQDKRGFCESPVPSVIFDSGKKMERMPTLESCRE
eukprot:comp21796_c0_seq2/m.30994 comp21796_c0_seq2/g.30994  ORF comp21796_c0_seq2/g.30994 comp21796_c0_seq2/m.30994 type:complete len:200 (-) comp21796_c0_seq2:618-1217(-)